MFSTMLAILVATGCAYVFSVPVSNNFELDAYFLYTMLVPGLVMALVTGFLARMVGTRVMTIVCVAWVTAMLVTCAIAASIFEKSNTANYMVSIGHFLTRQPALFSTYFASLLAAVTASLCHFLASLAPVHDRADHLARAGSGAVFAALAIAFCTTWLFMLYGFAWFMFSMAVSSGAALVLASIIPIAIGDVAAGGAENESALGMGAGSGSGVADTNTRLTPGEGRPPRQPATNMATRVLVTCSMICSAALAGWAFPIVDVVLDTTDFPPSSTYFIVKRTNALEAGLHCIAYGMVIATLLLVVLKVYEVVSARAKPGAMPPHVTTSQLGIVLSVAIAASILVQYLALGFVPAGLPFLPGWIGMASWSVLEVVRYVVMAPARDGRDAHHVTTGITVMLIPAIVLLTTILSWEGDGSMGYFDFLAGLVAGSVVLNVLAVVSCVVRGNGKLQAVLGKITFASIESRLLQSRRAGKATWIIGLVGGVALVSVGAVWGGMTIGDAQRRQVVAELNGRGLIYVVSPNDRVDPAFIPSYTPGDVSNVVSIEAAANEHEPIQLVFRATSSEQFTVYSVRFSNLTDVSNASNKIRSGNCSASWIDAVEELAMKWYDRVVPFSQRTVLSSHNEPLWLLFHVPNGTAEGIYAGTVGIVVSKVTGSDEIPAQETVEVEVRLRVFGFWLPSKPSLRSYYNFGAWTFDPVFGASTVEYARSHRMMAAYHVYPQVTINDLETHSITVDFTAFDARVSAMVGNQCLTYNVGWSDGWLPGGTFVVNGTSFTSTTFKYTAYYNATVVEFFRQIEAHLKSKPILGTSETWFDHAYIYDFDEAMGSRVQEALAYYKLLKDNDVNVSIFQTWHKGSIAEQGVLFDYVDVWCIHLKAGSGAGEDPFVSAIRARGKPIWIYTTTGPRFPVPTLSLNNQGESNRGLFWLCWNTNLSGYLIWSVVYFGHQNDGLAYQGWGGGMTMYPRDDGGLYGSNRNEMIREGNEDYEYFTRLRWAVDNSVSLGLTPAEVATGNSLLSRVNKLAPSHAELDFDTPAFYTLRHDIGTFLEQALA
jgi:hypothetical protein